MKSSANCFGVMLQAAASAAIAFLAGGELFSRVQNALSSLAADCRGPREPERKNLTFSFPRPGLESGMFFAEATKKETATRGVPARRGRKARRQESPRSPSPLGAFAVDCGRTFRKKCKNKTV
jgi:hypothetical protein